MSEQQFTAIGFDLFGVLIQQGNDPDPEMVSLIHRLRKNGYMVGLLSNVDANYEFLHKYHDAFAHFDRVQLSSDVGVAKPHPQAYLRFCVQLGAEPSQVIYIDDLPDNIRGAEDAGLPAIHYQPTTDLESDLTKLGINVS